MPSAGPPLIEKGETMGLHSCAPVDVKACSRPSELVTKMSSVLLTTGDDVMRP